MQVRSGLSSLLPPLLACAALVLAGGEYTPLAAQQEVSPTADDAALLRFARVHQAAAAARDEFHGRLARTHEEQERARLREELGATLSEILETHEMTQAEYDAYTLLISTDAEARATFERILADLSGTPRDTLGLVADTLGPVGGSPPSQWVIA